jgi:hypothetical protein
MHIFLMQELSKSIFIIYIRAFLYAGLLLYSMYERNGNYIPRFFPMYTLDCALYVQIIYNPSLINEDQGWMQDIAQ